MFAMLELKIMRISLCTAFVSLVHNDPNGEFFTGLIKVSNLRLSSAIVAEFVIFS